MIVAILMIVSLGVNMPGTIRNRYVGCSYQAILLQLDDHRTAEAASGQ
jgi:hypothetical protein